MKGSTVNCQWCSKLFVKKINKQLFCSNACRKKNHRRKHGKSEFPSFINANSKRRATSPAPAPQQYTGQRIDIGYQQFIKQGNKHRFDEILDEVINEAHDLLKSNYEQLRPNIIHAINSYESAKQVRVMVGTYTKEWDKNVEENLRDFIQYSNIEALHNIGFITM